MVTMNSDKAAVKRKPESNNAGCTIGSRPPNEEQTNIPQPTTSDESPNILLYKKIEKVIEKMQDENTGVPVRTVKSFMSKIPSVFTGSDLIVWMMKNLDVDDQQEALHLANLIAVHGYFFPIDDHMLTVKNDGTFYRFQTPYFWPSNCWEPENTDYGRVAGKTSFAYFIACESVRFRKTVVMQTFTRILHFLVTGIVTELGGVSSQRIDIFPAVYLCKRTMQNKTRLELADYEAENLARLQKMFSRKWEFIFMQAEAQSKVDKKRDKLERKVLDSQERAFWDVHRPMPGCVNTTEIDIKKACQINKPSKGLKNLQITAPKMSPSTSGLQSKQTVESVKKLINTLKLRLERRNIKVSKAAESFVAYYEQYLEYDPFFVPPEYPNPWISDSSELWEQEKLAKDISARRVKHWAFSLQELLQDAIGREHFVRFLDKEFSGENLKFWEAVQELKALPQSQVQDKVVEIWDYFLASDAKCPLNIDSHSYEVTKKNMEAPDRWTFDGAAAHVYHLMKSDSYSRYLRSEMYKEFLNGSKKKTSVKGIRSIVSFTARKDNVT